MRSVTLPLDKLQKLLRWWKRPTGIMAEFPVNVGWPELQLTEDQIMTNAVARASGCEPPYPDHSIFSLVFPAIDSLIARMPVVYIAGPYRGPNAWAIESNIRRAETVALELWRMGFAVICPHTNTRFFQGSAPDDIWLKGDLELLRRADCLFYIADSQGSQAERALAEELGLPIFRTYQDAQNWISDPQ